MGAGCPSPREGMGQGIGEQGLAETCIPVAQGYILRAGWFWLLSELRCAVCLELLYQGFPSQPNPR